MLKRVVSLAVNHVTCAARFPHIPYLLNASETVRVLLAMTLSSHIKVIIGNVSTFLNILRVSVIDYSNKGVLMLDSSEMTVSLADSKIISSTLPYSFLPLQVCFILKSTANSTFLGKSLKCA